MFDIGFWELVLIAVIGLVVLGPERLPVAVRTVARWVRTFRAMAASVQNELNQELKLQEMQENLKKAEQMNLKDLAPEVDASLRELKEAAASVQRPYANSQSAASPEPATASDATASAAADVTTATSDSLASTASAALQPNAAELAEQEEDEGDHPLLVAGLHEPLTSAEPVPVEPAVAKSTSAQPALQSDNKRDPA
ncbi:Sec-independent protein translocase protein TatB [Plesiomonas shigelloides]|uniref:Sec-independent protein translocase protein TatB n=1 Tax=Plesiomonas shigelloides TaxID=703 RepID=UPI0012627374|nr:Sec-independent protein translocase protein TatB [Plesiomonas shigelloides]KAB7690089.1 Sec-independent protein translocase subunit TatB [Plesiomonas shigelloides]MCQ8859954.1 Sec-independent protein translocase protein TatB [Plesiomonas shigelloides]